MRRFTLLFSIAIPLFLVAAFFALPGFLSGLTGFRPLDAVVFEALDRRPDDTLGEKDTPRFLADRNRIEVELPRRMQVGEFLDLYQLRYDHIRLQIGNQIGIRRPADEVVLGAGQKLTLELTPPGGPL